MKTLFLMERFAGGNPGSGESNSLHNFVSSLEELKTWDVEKLYFDEHYRHTGRNVDTCLLDSLEGVDVIFFTYLYGYNCNPSHEVLRKIKERGIPVICMWGDFCRHRKQEYEDVASLNLVIDIPHGCDEQRYYSTFTPQDPRIFNPGSFTRDLDLSFVGCDAKPDRREYIRNLVSEPFFKFFPTSLARQETCYSPEDYASLFKRSKISINFSKAENSAQQLKGRIFEILHCGAMLLSDNNERLSRYLTPGVEYIVFYHYDDLVSKAKYYLEHEDERLKIAQAGHNRVINDYNNRVFWKNLFKKIGKA